MATLPEDDTEQAGAIEGDSARYGRGRIVSRPYPVSSGLRSKGLLARRDALQTTNAWFEALDDSERDSWDAWAESYCWHDDAEFIEHRLSTYTVYATLAMKLLEITPDAEMLREPPYEPLEFGTLEIAARDGAGCVFWNANEPTPPHFVIELLAHRLRTPYQIVTAGKFRPLLYARFSAAALVQATALRPGWYALAYRFAHDATGQASSLRFLPLVSVQ